MAAPNYWDPPKMWFFRSNLYKIEVVITSFIEMQELPNFVHVNTSTIQFESDDESLSVTSSPGIITS